MLTWKLLLSSPAGLVARQVYKPASATYSKSGERKNMKCEEKMQMGKSKKNPYLSALDVEGALIPRHKPGPCQQPSVLLPGDSGHGDTRHHTRQL